MANVVPAELAKEFRGMLMRVAQQLSEDEMTRMAYEEGFTLELPPGSGGLQEMRVLFLHKLEAKGVFSTLHPEGFAALIQRLGRGDLMAELDRYKQNPLLTKTGKKSKEKGKAKTKSRSTDKRGSAPKIVTCTSTQENLQEMYALAMTHTTTLLASLEELRELLQQPLQKEQVEEIVPQVREAINVLSKDKELVGGVCESLRTIVAKSSRRKGAKSPTSSKGIQASKSMDFAPFNSSTNMKQQLRPPTSAQEFHTLSVGSQETVSMTTLGKGYDTYDQVPIRRNALESKAKPILPLKPNRAGGYVNVPGRTSDENLYSNVSSTYQNTGTPSGVTEVNYDEIVDGTDVDENNYGVIRRSDIGSGSGGAKPREWLPESKPTIEINYDEIVDGTEVDENNYGVIRRSDNGSGSAGAKPREWLPETKPITDMDELESNPLYAAQPSQERRYMKLLNRPELEGENSIYTRPASCS